MDMPAYHTLHVLQDVQIENQHEKNQNTIKHLVHYIYYHKKYTF